MHTSASARIRALKHFKILLKFTNRLKLRFTETEKQENEVKKNTLQVDCTLCRRVLSCEKENMVKGTRLATREPTLMKQIGKL